MGFFDEATEQQCYGYVAANPEPIRTLRGAMNSKVEPASALFFVCWAATIKMRTVTRRSRPP